MRPAFFLVGLIAALPTPAGAQSQVAPIVIRPAQDIPNCQIYLKADGSRLLFKGKPVTPAGQCPPDYLRGSVVRFGGESYRLQSPSRKADCVITAQGLGRCQPGVIEDPPPAAPPKPLPKQGGTL